VELKPRQLWLMDSSWLPSAAVVLPRLSWQAATSIIALGSAEQRSVFSNGSSNRVADAPGSDSASAWLRAQRSFGFS